MSILPDAHDFVINGGFRTVQNNIYQHGSTGIDILREASTPEAAVDAEERSYAPSCYPGTRDQYIEDITKWAAAWSSDNAQPIYWMKGPAGVGKSAIAQTCATQLKDEGRLGASFFFSINGRRKDHTRFFPTLAYQLSTIYHDFREIVNRKVSIDHTLVKKTMSSQFKSLIIEPLQELKEQGRDLQRRAIFIDGLDECESRNAQVEIIQIIALSIQTGSTPFHWAIFSREEPHIVSTFADPNIFPQCYSVLLPISRKADEEIELYLRGGFRNILQRRNLLGLSSSWPTAEDIKKLVDAAAGLFAHSAIVLRFIDNHSYSDFEESLEIVITSIGKLHTNTKSIYVELDRLYNLILQRVPTDVLPTMLLFLSATAEKNAIYHHSWHVASVCNQLGISKAVFQGIYHHLQAVLVVQGPPQLTIDKAVALDRSYYDQDLTFKPSASLKYQLLSVHGSITFHHKSFYEFITDPSRSSAFCVTTPAVREKLFNRYIQQHLHYGSSYSIHGSKLVSAPGTVSSSVSLSWPQGSEFVDSFLRRWSFSGVSLSLSHDDPTFGLLLSDIPSSSFHRLAELDYRKFLISDKMANGLGLLNSARVVGCGDAGTVKYTDDSVFTRIGEDKYDVFSPVTLLRIVEKLEKAGVIRPFDPRLGASRAASLLQTFSRPKPYGRSYGRYKMGHGDKSVIWYWEFDTKKRYYHEFRTINFARAMAYYKAEKLKIWEWSSEDYVTDSSEEGGMIADEDDEGEEDGRDGGNNMARGKEDD